VRGPPARIRKGITGFSWEGFSLPDPPAGGGMGKPGFPMPLRGGGVGKPGFPTSLRAGCASHPPAGGGTGKPGFPTPLFESLCSR